LPFHWPILIFTNGPVPSTVLELSIYLFAAAIPYNGRVNKDKHRAWIPYVATGVIAVAVAAGFWYFDKWLGG
jgi:hypothetical protein